MALALTGSSTCTLIAFVFPAVLFVQAAKETNLKADSPVREKTRKTPLCTSSFGLFRSHLRDHRMMLTECCVCVCLGVALQPPPPSQVRMAMIVGVVGCIFGTIATIAVLKHGGGGHGRRLSDSVFGSGDE